MEQREQEALAVAHTSKFHTSQTHNGAEAQARKERLSFTNEAQEKYKRRDRGMSVQPGLLCRLK